MMKDLKRIKRQCQTKWAGVSYVNRIGIACLLAVCVYLLLSTYYLEPLQAECKKLKEATASSRIDPDFERNIAAQKRQLSLMQTQNARKKAEMEKSIGTLNAGAARALLPRIRQAVTDQKLMLNREENLICAPGSTPQLQNDMASMIPDPYARNISAADLQEKTPAFCNSTHFPDIMKEYSYGFQLHGEFKNVHCFLNLLDLFDGIFVVDNLRTIRSEGPIYNELRQEVPAVKLEFSLHIPYLPEK